MILLAYHNNHFYTRCLFNVWHMKELKSHGEFFKIIKFLFPLSLLRPRALPMVLLLVEMLLLQRWQSGWPKLSS